MLFSTLSKKMKELGFRRRRKEAVSAMPMDFSGLSLAGDLTRVAGYGSSVSGSTMEKATSM